MAATIGRSDKYLGETKKQLRDGFGVYTYGNKYFRYEGEWKNGQKNGHGKLSMGDGSYYEGEFKNGEIEGHGFRYWATTRNTYSGQFCQGELHGQGVMRYADGLVYEGEWHRNKRQGYGVYSEKNGFRYTGYFYDHKRHGEGVAEFPNGDIYKGNWVHNKKQGHGELMQKDGSKYEGQWNNDLFNGQGVMQHCSGFTYDGMWINGKPASKATKIVLVGIDSNTLEVSRGEPFTIQIELRNDAGELVEDQGRELKISAGFKHLVAKEGLAIYSSIEDTEEEPVPTPFGYAIVGYPLTDQVPDQQHREGGDSLTIPKSYTNLSDQSIDELGESEAPDAKEEADLTVPEGGAGGDMSRAESPVDDTGRGTETALDDPSTPPPPPIASSRSDAGTVTWPTVFIPPPPFNYKPFAILDALADESGANALKKVKSKTPVKDAGSRPSTKQSLKSLGVSEKVARSGDYVLMVHDITTPPWQDEVLEPAFLLIKVKKQKKAPKPKEKEKKWDTQKHIAQSMAKSYADSSGLEDSEAGE